MLLRFATNSQADFEALSESGERLLNYFVGTASELTQGSLWGRSGLRATADIAALIDVSFSVRIEAAIEMAGAVYCVAGGKLYKVAGGAVTEVGAVGLGAAEMATSGQKVAIIADGRYFLSDGLSVTEFTTGPVTDPVSVTFLDGYFIVAGSSGGRNDAITISGPDDGETFSDLDFAFAENTPDAIRAIVADHGELVIFGTQTVEYWYNSGDADFPFAPNRGKLTEQGCYLGATVVKSDNGVFWVDNLRRVQRTGPSAPQIVSSRNAEALLRDAEIEGAYSFIDRGHLFYAVRRSNDTTLCFDVTTGLWSERSTGVGENPWAPTCAVSSNGVQYLATDTGRLCVLDGSVFQDDGETIVAEAVSVPVTNNGEIFTVSKLHVDIRMGEVSLDTTPQVMMQVSRDGHTWSRERWRNLGALGQYFRRAAWHGLGAGRRMQVRLRITDAVTRDIIGAFYK